MASSYLCLLNTDWMVKKQVNAIASLYTVDIKNQKKSEFPWFSALDQVFDANINAYISKFDIYGFLYILTFSI